MDMVKRFLVVIFTVLLALSTRAGIPYVLNLGGQADTLGVTNLHATNVTVVGFMAGPQTNNVTGTTAFAILSSGSSSVVLRTYKLAGQLMLDAPNGTAMQNNGVTIAISQVDRFYVTTNLLVWAPTNGVAPPSFVFQPIGIFGSMMMSNTTNTVTIGSSGTYYVLTNYATIRTNGFSANGATGYLTNLLAGFYRISYYVTATPGASDTLETEISVNGTGKEEISGFHTFANPARIDQIAGNGVLYLAANSFVALTINNRSDTDNVTVWRAGFTIGTP